MEGTKLVVLPVHSTACNHFNAAFSPNVVPISVAATASLIAISFAKEPIFPFIN